jgi:hypothetical protein
MIKANRWFPARVLALLALLALVPAQPAAGVTRLVNMVPQARSGETNQDAEPTITVDPANPSHLAGSAFTWDNLTGGPMVTATAPIYVSNNGGLTWSMALIVPSSIGSGFPTGDINLQFGSANSGAPNHTTSWLYGGILQSPSRPMSVLRSQDFLDATVMTVLDTRTGNVDQPHVDALTGGGQDRLYVGFNNGFGCTATNGRSAAVDVSQSAAVTTPAFALDPVEFRNTACQDGFAIVPAVHSDGTVYVAFMANWSSSPRIVVVRDDNWGASAQPFQALVEPAPPASDGVAGRFVTTAITVQAGSMGQNRLGASNINIAVDPNDSDRVYVAYGDSGGSNTETIHVRRSTDRGRTWSADLLTVTNAMNPQVAINSMGTVGILYQRLVSGRWETRIAQTTDPDGTTFNGGLLLANTDATSPGATYSPYIGDYASLRANGHHFIGMFSASNYPDKANYLSGVRYQRFVDWTTHKLFSDASKTTTVSPSIDPFFFEANIGLCELYRWLCRPPVFNICIVKPWICHGVFDPWWKFKCPQCNLNVVINPGDEVTQVVMYDDRGTRIGAFRKLERPVQLRGQTYTYGLRMRARPKASYVLIAEQLSRRRGVEFNPTHATINLSKVR